jgi:hypothetical protein
MNTCFDCDATPKILLAVLSLLILDLTKFRVLRSQMLNKALWIELFCKLGFQKGVQRLAWPC